MWCFQLQNVQIALQFTIWAQSIRRASQRAKSLLKTLQFDQFICHCGSDSAYNCVVDYWTHLCEVGLPALHHVHRDACARDSIDHLTNRRILLAEIRIEEVFQGHQEASGGEGVL